MRQQLPPSRDAVIVHQQVEIVPRRFGELGLRVEQIHDVQVGRQVCSKALEVLPAYAAPFRVRPQAGNAIAEIGSGGAYRIGGHRRIAGGRRIGRSSHSHLR